MLEMVFKSGLQFLHFAETFSLQTVEFAPKKTQENITIVIVCTKQLKKRLKISKCMLLHLSKHFLPGIVDVVLRSDVHIGRHV